MHKPSALARLCLPGGGMLGFWSAPRFPAGWWLPCSLIPALSQREGQMESGVLGSREQVRSPTLPPRSESG